MNKAEVIKTIQNIFHSTYVEGKGISMADWGVPIFLNVEFYDDGINIDDISFVSRFDDDKMAQQAYRVISQVMSNSLRYITCEGHNGIMAFPINCNLYYCKDLRDAFEMNEGEDRWDYHSRIRGKQPVNNSSRKPINSDFDDDGNWIEDKKPVRKEDMHGEIKKLSKEEHDDLKPQVEEELDRWMSKKHFGLDKEVYDETVEYIISLFGEVNYAPKDVKEAVSSWYNDTLESFPEMLKGKGDSRRIASAAYLRKIKSSRLIK